MKRNLPKARTENSFLIITQTLFWSLHVLESVHTNPTNYSENEEEGVFSNPAFNNYKKAYSRLSGEIEYLYKAIIEFNKKWLMTEFTDPYQTKKRNLEECKTEALALLDNVKETAKFYEAIKTKYSKAVEFLLEEAGEVGLIENKIINNTKEKELTNDCLNTARLSIEKA